MRFQANLEKQELASYKRKVKYPIRAFLFVASLLIPENAHPQETNEGSRHEFLHSGLLAGRANPIALFGRFEFAYQHELFSSNHVLLEDTYAGISLQPFTTPAFTALGMKAQIQPLSILNLSALYRGVGYYGSWDLLQSFQGPDSEYAVNPITTHPVEASNATLGQELEFGAILQAKIGSIAVRSTAQARYFNMALQEEGHTVFYDIVFDTLVPNQGWAVNNDFDWLYIGDGFAAGIRHTFTHAFYGEENAGENTPMHRVGPMLAYSLPTDRFRDLTLIGVVNWWIRHRYRTGTQVHQAMPYILIGLQYEGQLWE